MVADLDKCFGYFIEENAEREQLIKELESELELLRIEYETVCQQRKPK